MMRGCRSTEVFALTKNRDFGNSVILCRECAQGAANVIGTFYVQPITQNAKNQKTEHQAEKALPVAEPEKLDTGQQKQKKAPAKGAGKRKTAKAAQEG